MPNTILTATEVTREALRVLHQKLNFVGTVTRDYDDRFAQTGAKIGDTLKIRLPNQYTVRSGATLNLSNTDTAESTVDLKVEKQKGVDLNFTSVDLTLALDDFSERVLEPAMSVLAANIEADAMGMYKDIWNQVNNQTQAASFSKVLEGRKILVDNLAPLNARTCNLNTQDNLDLVDSLKNFFNDKTNISKQNREGYMGRTAGFDFVENTLWPSHTQGARGGTPLTNGATADGATQIVTDGWSNSITGVVKVGDVFTLPGVFRVHPETKLSTGIKQQFVVTEDANSNGSGQATVKISPAIILTGAKQNVSAAPADNTALEFPGAGGSVHGISMAYQKGAFAFATADMVMPRGVDFAAREVFDGVSMRIVRQYDINNDKFPCRLDVLYGYKTIRPQLACRLANK
jgi:hypothetical protein